MLETGSRLRTLLIATLLICPILLSAQAPRATIRVEVKAEDRAVAGAVVTMNATDVRTGEDGIALAEVAPGEVEIRVTKDGYFPATAKVNADEPREWRVEVALQEAEEREVEITVYATRTDRRLQDLPTRVEVLDEEEVEEKTLMTPGDIVMMLNEMGGVRVQTTSPALGAANVRIQGMSGRYTRFLSDGLPLFGQEGGGLGLLQIPPMDLGQVEVIKGSASALYGAGAMAGVVDLIARRPAKEPVVEVLANRSSAGASDGAVFLAGPLTKEWSASFLGGGYFQEENDVNGDGWADLAGYSRGVARPRFFWDGGDGRNALITGGVTYEDRTGGTMPGSVLAATGKPYVEALETRRYDIGGSLQLPVKKKYIATTRFAASWQRHDHAFGEVRERDGDDTLFGEVTVRGEAGRNNWLAGAAVEHDRFAPTDVPRFAHDYVTPGVFAQDDLAITPWFSISASGRADFQNRYGTLLSPRLAALLHWEGWTSRISAGQGFATPTPLTEETEAAGLTRLTMPQALTVERGRTVSADLTRNWRSISLTGTVFGATVKNPVYVERGAVYAITNLHGATDDRGVEFLGTWRKAPFTVLASYTFVQAGEPDLAGGRVDVPLTPRHNAGLTAMWEQKGKWKVGVEGYYTGRQRLEENPYRTASQPYFLEGFMAERRVGKARLFINAENLGNVRQTRWDPLLRPMAGADGRWTVDAWAPLDGRVINGGVRFWF